MIWVFGDYDDYMTGTAEEPHLEEIWEQIVAIRRRWA